MTERQRDSDPLTHRPFNRENLTFEQRARESLIPARAADTQNQGKKRNKSNERRRKRSQRKDRFMAHEQERQNGDVDQGAPPKTPAPRGSSIVRREDSPRYGEFTKKAAIVAGMFFIGTALYESVKYGLTRWLG